MGNNKFIEKNYYRWIILLVATIAQTSACFFVQGIGPLAEFFKKDFSLSDSQIGLLSSAAQFLPIIGLLVAGELLDKFNERYIVGVGAVGVSATLLLGTIADNYISLLLCLLIVGGFYSSVQPGGAKSVSSWFPQSQRGFAMGIRQAGLPLGGALAGIVLPASARIYGIQGAFLVGAIVSFLGGCLFIIFYHSRAKVIAIVPEKRGRVSFYTNVRSRLAMLAAPHMKNIIFSGVSLTIVQYVLTIFITIYFHRIYHLSLDKSAYLFFVSQTSGALGRIILAAWSDHCRKGRFFPVLFCMIAVVFGLLILILSIHGSIIYLTLLSAWLGFFGMGWYGPWVAYIVDSSPKESIGFSLGLAMSVNQIAIITAPPLFGLIQDFTDTYLLTWLILILMIVFSLFLIKK
ncbi:MFS transporter [Bartonella mastomydis]|uniref:MFS transporter n=1 Tax=Bartonella mastomydis TaxID=1820002 RepID=UPI0011169461|nr:MFS transporter [Bartonella mastomydis]